MVELVEFLNTGRKEFDGVKMKILDSNIKQKTFLKTLGNCILKARSRGYDSTLIGNHLILQIMDYNKKFELEDAIKYLESRHITVKDKWKKNRDIVVRGFFIDKLAYSKNFAPFSIFPFDVETCTDILMGRIMIYGLLNYSEIFRIIEKAGWQIIDGFHLKSEEEIRKLKDTEWETIDFLTVRKPPLNVVLPPSIFGRLKYELLSPKVIIQDLDEHFERDPKKEHSLTLVNYLDERNIWVG
jgi:hypothetical protein